MKNYTTYRLRKSIPLQNKMHSENSDMTTPFLKIFLCCFFILFTVNIFSQTRKGIVLSDDTNLRLGFVSVGIIGKNIGTVSDESGNFTIDLDKVYDNDSLRFSAIGYVSKSFLVRQFKEDSIKTVYLIPRIYNLLEVKVTYHKDKEIVLGNPVTTDLLKSGFGYNSLGSELGIKIHVKKEVLIDDININVATCTYDSVIYRLNIYRQADKNEFINILTKPIYFSFTKDRIKSAVTFNLRKYSIVIEGDILVTLELFKDLGEGKLLFYTTYFTGYTYHRQTSEGTWTKSPGIIGMYLHGRVIK
jgi:hypothetical protein